MTSKVIITAMCAADKMVEVKVYKGEELKDDTRIIDLSVELLLEDGETLVIDEVDRA
jgi:hypothetical protein